ncbi:glycosyltransferase family 4 protein [Aeromicrobium sp.]|uniref:glycosyltransferase family 4 protein n=1 Tax=Aeromicrobium sp. TaxID=1871063 RepID=UPI002FC82AB2
MTYDDRLFTFQRRGGPARYFAELITTFRTNPELGIEVDTPFTFIETEYLLRADPRYRRLRLPESRYRMRAARAANRVRQGPRVKKAEILHHTQYSSNGLRAPAAVRVCTVYDMIPELFPEVFEGRGPIPQQRKSAYVEACDAIACISESTKADVLAHYGDLDKPVVVTPLGADARFFAATPDRRESPDFVLYVGTRDFYKNFDVLLRALARIDENGTAPRLLCVGPPLTPVEQERIASLGLTGRVSQRSASDAELPGLYAAAMCLVFPSRYEGFGLPTVEAFAAGCPVVLANMACAVEVGGEAAQYFEPDDDETLATTIARFAGDPAGRDRWIEAGRARARDFTWQRTAEATAALYRSVAGASV